MRHQFAVLSAVFLLGGRSWSQEDRIDNNLDGKFLYEDYAGCASCHGLDGKGAEGLALDPPPPDFTDCGFNT